MKIRFKYFVALIIFWLILLVANVSWAALVPCGPGTAVPMCNSVCYVLVLISNIIFFCVFKLMPPLAGLLFLIGGIMMIASAGSEERYKKGRKVIVDTAIGVVIVLASWVIVNALITTIGTNTVNGFNPQRWWEPPMCN